MPAGHGMTVSRLSGASGTTAFTASLCPINTYGAIELTWGLKFAPCKPCPRGLITLEAGMTSADNCTNPSGWGYNGFTAEICASGSWAAPSTLMTCTDCPIYRNTTSISPLGGIPFTDAISALPLPSTYGTDQDHYTDCKVMAGYGVLTTANSVSLSLEQKAALDIGECPIGTFGVGGEVASVCTACAATAGDGSGGLGPYSTTEEAGAASAADCKGGFLSGLSYCPHIPKFMFCGCQSILV